MPKPIISESKRRLDRLRRTVRQDGAPGLVRLARRALLRQWNYLASRRSRAARLLLVPEQGPSADSLGGPIVSVIVASYNRAELLSTALRSIQLQEFQAWECIVVDDSSTDNSLAVAQSFVDADARFRLLRHSLRMGLATVRNTGIAVAEGDFLCFLDDDDFLLAGSLCSRVDSLRRLPQIVGGVYCDWINVDPGVGLTAFEPSQRARAMRRVTFVSLGSGTPFISSSPLLRRSVVLSVGGFNEDFDQAEDAELWFRLCRLGFQFVPVDHVGVAYRRSPNSMVLGAPSEQLDGLVRVYASADIPAPELAGLGPAPVLEPLSDVALSAANADSILPYLALLSMSDTQAAILRGCQLISSSARAAIEPPDECERLTRYVCRRLSLSRTQEIDDAKARIAQLVAGLEPDEVESWTPSVSIGPWITAREGRADVIGRTPSARSTTKGSLDGVVVLIAEAEYHVDELGPLAIEFRRRGRRVQFMLSPDTTAATRSALGRYTDSFVQFDPAAVGAAAAIVTLNDWGALRELIAQANDQGIPTFAKVEGAQDFDDIDTGRVRTPYRTVSIVLAQGSNDSRALRDRRVEIVGSSRLEDLWNGPPADRSDWALVNLNFTFNVQLDHRDRWIRSACEGVRKAELDGFISVHPSEHSRHLGLPILSKPFRHEIRRTGVLISRFSTVPFEAMALGVPFVYHNPHGEKVPTFSDPRGAFCVTRSVAELSGALRDVMRGPTSSTRRSSEAFFREQVDIEPGRSPAQRACDVIEAEL